MIAAEGTASTTRRSSVHEAESIHCTSSRSRTTWPASEERALSMIWVSICIVISPRTSSLRSRVASWTGKSHSSTSFSSDSFCSKPPSRSTPADARYSVTRRGRSVSVP